MSKRTREYKGFQHRKDIGDKVSNEPVDDYSLSSVLSRSQHLKRRKLARRTLTRRMKDSYLQHAQLNDGLYGKSRDRVKSIQKDILEGDLYDMSDGDEGESTNVMMKIAPKQSHSNFMAVKNSVQSAYNHEHRYDPSAPNNPFAGAGLSVTDTHSLFKSANITQTE